MALRQTQWRSGVLTFVYFIYLLIDLFVFNALAQVKSWLII